MPAALPNDLRWRAVFKVWMDGQDFEQAATALSAGPRAVKPRWVHDMWDLFQETGNVRSRQGKHTVPDEKRMLGCMDALQIIDIACSTHPSRC